MLNDRDETLIETRREDSQVGAIETRRDSRIAGHDDIPCSWAGQVVDVLRNKPSVC
jgi:hypothetical protein